MIVLVLSILLGVSAVANVILVFVALRLSSRLLQFDDLFVLLAADIKTNVMFFRKLLETPLFENSTEMQSAQKNIDVIAHRLDEFLLRMEEASNRELVKRGE